MPISILKHAIVRTKFRFSIFVLALAVLVVVGSFVLIDYLRFSVTSQGLFLSSLMYRAEYIAKYQGANMFAAAGEALSPSIIARISDEKSKALGIPVLTYHSIVEIRDPNATTTVSSFEGANVTREHFKDQMFELKAAGWHTVTYDDFDAFIHGKKDLPAKSFVITFDDGAMESFYPADPILAALGFHAVAFILPKHSLGERSTYYMNKRDLNLMKGTGRWSIQSHGQDIHASFPTSHDQNVKDNALSNRMWLPEEGRLETHEEYKARIDADLALAKRNLEQALKIPIRGFAFPFGDYGQNASNNPLAQATVLEVARKHYTLAFYQNWNKGNFTFNYPNPDAFLIKRIPVDPKWDGKKLLEVLEAASPKDLPYDGEIKEGEGWEQDWGKMEIANGNMKLTALPDTTGALAILDGTYTWENYQVEIPIEWQEDFVMLLFNMQSEGIGRACVFSHDGTVQLQERTPEDIFILRESKKREVTAGAHTIGAVSSGTTTACVFDGEYVIDATLSPGKGGIGVEAWSPTPGKAQATVKGISAKKKR